MESKESKNRIFHLNFLLANLGFSGSTIVKSLKLPKTTVSNDVKLYNESLTVEKTPGSGRPAGLA